MSMIYGVLKEHGVTVTESELRHLAAATERYATGAGAVHVQGRLGMEMFHPGFCPRCGNAAGRSRPPTRFVVPA